MQGLPPGGIVNVVREDPQRRGLLFAGTEQAVYVSFDDGDSWQSAADQHARDVDPRPRDQGRRSRRRHARARLLDPRRHQPAPADHAGHRQGGRVPVPPVDRVAVPLEPEHRYAAAARRAGGAQSARRRDDQLPARTGHREASVTLEIVETVTGEVIRRYSSDDPEDPPVPDRNMPDYWIRPPQRLATTPGLHRFVWDVRYAPPAVERVHVSDRGHRREHAQGAARDVGGAGHVSGAPDGRRKDAPTGRRGANGSASADVVSRPRAAVQAVEVARRHDAAARPGEGRGQQDARRIERSACGAASGDARPHSSRRARPS